MTEIHKNEPALDELKKIRRDVIAEEATPENLKKVQAIMSQITRHEAAAAERKAAEQAAKEMAEAKETQEV